MNVKQLERAALEAGRNGESWGTFWQRHREHVRLAEPHDRAAFHRLHGRLLHLHLTGDGSGQFGVGDDDAMPWERDDQHVPDVGTAARCDWGAVGQELPQ